jgi:cytochrome c peroxidase
MSAEKVELGRQLFYDVRLSGNGTQACGSCHRPELAFTDGKPVAVGSTGQSHTRSAMSLVNAAYAASLTWADPGQRSLEDQALVPLTNEHPVEMGISGHEAEVLIRFERDPVYPALFERAFPDRPAVDLENVRKAIASFERTLISADSSYDRYLWRDDRDALSASAVRGMDLFFSERLRCGRCHASPTFSGPAVWEGSAEKEPAFPNNGLAPRADRGLAAATGRDRDVSRFRAPTLRNISVTGPYMHDGRFATLEDVVGHYAQGGDAGAGANDLAPAFSLTAGETCDLVAFLESLTDARFLADPRHADPFAVARH